MDYSEKVNENDYGMGTYGDFVRSEKGVSRIARYYVKRRHNNRYLVDDSVLSMVCERLGKFVKQSGDAKSPAERTLCDIACDDDIFTTVREEAFDKIAAPTLKAKARAKMDEYYKAHPGTSPTAIKMENTLIAMDSGLGRSG